ncbi:recombinase family protein [Amycolatopsis sp. CA-230715]|uniref:recombinase family protein n=1 Tax=Amycolatopsis sp. CA-230715 TaxID=2745196 RepID=UPI001C01CA4F|nr:recombinase family protein [Amycolatopsis sp. CA-230715]QWF83776.1 hypothetical protein HUW46_07219 [Amycolatopsis sp. CA-230715]
MGKALTRRLAKTASGQLPPLRAVIYARASKDRKGRQMSVSSQVVVGRRFCKEHGITVVAVLIDNDLSASRYATEDRPEYREALRLLSTSEANLLWTWENSRAQRELGSFVRLRNILVEVGGYWAYDDRVYDMNDSDDRIDTAEDAVDSERESEKIRKRTRRGVEARAMESLWHGPASYGYRKVFDPRTGEALRMEKDPATSKVVKRIVDRLIQTGNETEVAAALDADGVPCPREQHWRADHVRKLHVFSQDEEGWARFTAALLPEQLDSVHEALALAKEHSASQVAQRLNRGQWPQALPGRWNAAKVRNIAMNPVIAGYRVHRGQIIGKGVWEPIIKARKHAVLLARIGDPARSTRKDGIRVKYLLSGIMLCEVCERGVGSNERAGQMVYRCRDGHRSRNMARTDAFVVEAVLARLESADAAELFRFRGKEKDATKALAKAAELRARLDGFTDQAAEGNLTPERLARIEAKLLPKIETAEKRASQIIAAPAVAELVGPQARQVWARMSLTQQREALRPIVRPRLAKAIGGRSAFDPSAIRLSWLGAPVAVPDSERTRQDEAGPVAELNRHVPGVDGPEVEVFELDEFELEDAG